MIPEATSSISDMARYRAAARGRKVGRDQRLAARRDSALEVAARAATLLKGEHGVTRVVLFGSLARDEMFSPHSDIDLVAWELDAHKYYRTVSQLLDLEPSIAIDLLRGEELPPELHAIIESEGIEL